MNAVLRAGALLGYLAVFLAALSSNYMRELTLYFGRPFPKVHHVISVTALVALTLHGSLVAVRSGSLGAFLPAFSSFQAFFSLGGRPALWLLAVTSLTALFRTSLRKSWKTIHWLNYIAFFLGTIHAQMIGSSFDSLPVRIVSIVMTIGLVVVFVLKRRTEAQRRQRRAS
jgi:hypothetical protein